MTSVFLGWGIVAATLLFLAGFLGRAVGRGPLGILIDDRGRYSLTHLQLVLWSVIVISLIGGVAFARIVSGLEDALGFTIPNELLLVMGISLGSTAVTGAVKASKDTAHPEKIAACNDDDPPRLRQLFLVEEGELADKIIDITKYQNFWLTIVLVAAYVVLVISELDKAGSIANVKALPGFSSTFVTLLAVSHAAYIAGKIPTPPGTPSGLTLALREAGAKPDDLRATASPATQQLYVPRNPLSHRVL